MIVNYTDPQYVDFSDIEFGGDLFGNYFSYDFNKDIPANDTFIVQFHMTAIKVGDYSGSVDVCINSVANCREFLVRTVVQ
jgi:hypothetical protein